MGELKPCPFCGRMPELRQAQFGMEKFKRFAIVCPTCQFVIGWEETEEGAAEKWNRRAEPSKLEIKHAISNVEKPAGLDDEQFFAVLANVCFAVAKTYGEEISEYIPSEGRSE